jgi:CheY-like chemotaxis protein
MAGERVLVVDDSLVYRDLLVNHVLTPSGYTALTAKDGETGLRSDHYGHADAGDDGHPGSGGPPRSG